MSWQPGDRVKVSPDHHGTGLASRLGTVLRVSPSGLVEVDLDSFWLAGIGIVAFRPDDLVPTKKQRHSERRQHRPGWLVMTEKPSTPP